MKGNRIKLVLILILAMAASCDEPETTVTDYVHTDGSVTRVIKMRNKKKEFKKSDFQVPFDGSWLVQDSIETNKKGDTTWVKKAEKLFRNVSEINALYKLDTGVNKIASRHADFTKSFRWFNTKVRFSEVIDEKLANAYPVNNYLTPEELSYFYFPESLKSEKEHGQDSLKYRSLSDSLNNKTNKWIAENFIAVWIEEFSKLTLERGNEETSREYLREHQKQILSIVETNSDKFDSLWAKGVILREIIGENNALKYKNEADSALSLAENKVLINFNDYSVRIIMPGKVTATNGFIDSSKVLLWPVKADYFLTQPYEMWAESKFPNIWAWIVSGLFILFVFTGVVIHIRKKG